jgi:hypothetical protein
VSANPGSIPMTLIIDFNSVTTICQVYPLQSLLRWCWGIFARFL